MIQPERFTAAESEAISRGRKGRNWAIFVALILLMLMFYAITIVKLTKA